MGYNAPADSAGLLAPAVRRTGARFTMPSHLFPAATAAGKPGRTLNAVLGVLGALAAVALWGGGAPAPASAQAETAPPAVESALASDDTRALLKQAETLSADERRRLLGRLTDSEVRDLVWTLIAVEAPPAPAQGDVIDELADTATAVRQTLHDRAAAVVELPALPAFIADAMTPPGRDRGTMFRVLLGIVLIVAAGLLAQALTARLLRGLRQQAHPAPDASFSRKLGFGIVLLLLRMLDVAAFVAGATILFFALWHGHEPNRYLALAIIAGVALYQTAVRVSQFLFTPHDASLRLMPLSDPDASAVSVRVNGIVALAVAIFTLDRYLTAIGVRVELVDLITLTTALALIVLINVFAWQAREPIGRAIRGPGERTGAPAAFLGHAWHVLFGITVILVYVVAVVAMAAPGDVPEGVGFLTLMVVTLLPFVLGSVRPLVHDALRLPTESLVTVGEVVHSRPGLQKPVTRLIRVTIIALAVIYLGWLWGVDVVAAVDTRLGSRIGEAALQIAAAALTAYLLWLVAKRAIDPYMPDDVTPGAPAEDMGGTGVSRVATLMPLIRKAILVTLVSVTAMIIMSAIGVHIGPLLAGAGVVGLAVGFGAQSLISDIISGIFFLMDDAFRKGEYIEIGNIRGTVEKISVRSFQLRHHKGAVHTVPYGQITSLTNYSRDWAIMKFELRIPFEVDVEKVRKIIKKVGQELMDDADITPLLLEPLKSQGVNRMDDSAFIVRCKFTAKPGHQFYVRRVAYARIQEAFQKEGIQFAPKRVIVEAVTPEIAAAGAAAIETEAQANATQDDERG